MPKVSISEAARLTGKPRSTIHRHIKGGKLSKEQDRSGNPVIDVSELERVYGPLQIADMGQTEATGQRATGVATAVDREELAVLRRENELLRSQLDDVQQDRNHWRQQATALLTGPQKRGFLSRLLGKN